MVGPVVVCNGMELKSGAAFFCFIAEMRFARYGLCFGIDSTNGIFNCDTSS